MAADVVVNKQGKCGYEDENGKLIVGYKYTYINSFNENGLALVMKGSKYGFVNKMGVEVLPAIYDKITDFDHGVAQITKGKKVGLVDKNATIILKPTYLEIGKFNSQNITWATKDKLKFKYSVIDTTGKEIIPVQKSSRAFATITLANNHTVRVAQTTFKTIPGANGINITMPITTGVVDIDIPVANNVVDVYNYTQNKKPKGNVDTLDVNTGYIAHIGFAPFSLLGSSSAKNIYYDLNGKEVFNPNIFNAIYQNVFSSKYQASTCSPLYLSSATKENVMLLTMNKYNGKTKNTYTIAYVYYDLIEQEIIRYDTYEVTADYIDRLTQEIQQMKAQAANGKSTENFTKDFTKLTGTLINPIPHVLAYAFNEGFARITLFDGNTKNDVVINKLGQEVARYKECSDYQDGRMIVKEQNDLYGVVDYQQQTIIPAIYKSISKPAGEFYAVLSYNGKCGTINIKNDTLVPIIYEKVQINADGITRAKTLDKWDIYHFDTLYYQCADGVEPILYKKSLLLQYADNTVQVYDILTKKTSPIYSGCSDVLNAPSLHGGICYEVYQNSNGKKLYGYVNAHAEVVVPVVFERIDWAYRAYLEYKDSPAATFTEIDVYRLRLNHTLRERTYKLNSVIPTSDWDY